MEKYLFEKLLKQTLDKLTVKCESIKSLLLFIHSFD